MTGPRPDSDRLVLAPGPTHLTDLIARYRLSHIDPGAPKTIALIGTNPVEAVFALRDGKVTVGRSPMAAVIIDHESISRAHATLDVDTTSGQVKLLDNDSANGTFVNGARVMQAELTDGDVIHFGPDVRFLLVTGVVGETTPADADDAPPLRAFEAMGDTVSFGNDRPTVMPGPDRTRTEVSDQQRRQLAVLLQIAMRYLEAGPETNRVELLFGVLERVVAFDVAFLAASGPDGLRIATHPRGARLKRAEYEALVDRQTDGAVFSDEGAAPIKTSVITAGSYALVPAGDACLGLLGEETGLYADDAEFLTLLAKIHATATRGK